LPVFITPKTLHNSALKLNPSLVNSFSPNQTIQIGELSVNPFSKRHDASDAHSFTVSGNGVTIGILTDIGSVCEQVVNNFKQCNAVFLEANYDENMLEEGHYPYFLKNRIRGGHGHLSNQQALELFLNHKHPNLSHLILAHLSKDNNSPEKVETLFKKHAGTTEVVVASRDEESSVFQIQPLVQSMDQSKPSVFKTEQLSIF
jgi:phosphoribosyl 1,2-cyclic phosphodiesterase